jgi:phage/plasmid-associated DNA primase
MAAPQLDPATRRHYNDQIANLLIKSIPELAQRVRMTEPTHPRNHMADGYIFLCDTDSNVWSRASKVQVEQFILSHSITSSTPAATLGLLNEADVRYITSTGGIRDIAYVICSRYLDNAFPDRLDASPELFAVANGAIDLRLAGPADGGRMARAFRALEPGDLVSQHAGWAYDASRAAAHRDELEAYLQRVFPVPEEQAAVLGFFAALLSGRREAKQILVLMDGHARGNSGKSTFLALMWRFFGAYGIRNTRLVCRPRPGREGNLAEDLAGMRGTRLVVADELAPDQTLDTGLLKHLTSGANNTIQGRTGDRGDRFEFEWQAGIVLACDRDNMPAYDADDAAFTQRLVVVPFRSRFVPEEPLGGAGAASAVEAHTYPQDLAIGRRLDGWLPALADLLLEMYGQRA